MTELTIKPLARRVLWMSFLLGVLVSLSWYNYLLFHSLAELFSVVIACGMFMIAWNARRHYRNDYLLFIGTAYLFVAFLDTLHMLGYHGMSIFKEIPGYNLGPQLWLVARLMEASTLVAAPWFLRHRLRPEGAFAGYALCTVIALWMIFIARIFPVCFIPEQGLTTFKIVSEYVIIALLLAALALLMNHRKEFDRLVFRLLLGSILLTVASELCFTLYISHYGPSNLFGHIFKIISFTLIYFAIIDTALNRPYALLFRDLKQRQDAMLAAQRAAKMGSWSWRIGAPEMVWTEGVFRQLGLDEGQSPAALAVMVASMHPDDRDALRQAFLRAEHEQRPFVVDVRRLCLDGNVCYLHVEGDYARDDDGSPFLAGIVRDVTDRVLADRLRDDIDNITRHDMRSPLTPIIGLPELLLSAANLTATQREMLQDIRHCGLKMLDMINGSLTLYKIERGTYQLQPGCFDLTSELRQILREIATKAESRGVRCELSWRGKPLDQEESLTIYGEKLLCYTLFANLITNAVEASPTAGRVAVDLDEADTLWLIAIHNEGEVPPSIRGRFFEKFVTHGKRHGTGLGTYSALMVARAHGGTIRLDTGDAGTTLTVELPKPAGSAMCMHATC